MTEPSAVITGGAGGVGRAVAARLLEEGWRVGLIGRTPASLDAACDELGPGAKAAAADVSDRAAVARALERLARAHGPPTLLVNAAGLAVSAPLVPPDDALWRQTFATNATGPWVVSTACLPGMLEAGGGVIVNVASTAALRGYRYVAAYVASKHALLGLTRALAEDLRSKNVQVHAVCPGFLDTEMTDRTVEAIVRTTGRTEDEARASLARMNLSGRLIGPEEVAEEVVALAAARDRTGEIVVLE